MDVPDGLPDGDRVGGKAVKRPTDEEMLDAIAGMTLLEFLRLRQSLILLLAIKEREE